MHEHMLEVLACPDCGAAVDVLGGLPTRLAGRAIASATLRCLGCGARYPVLGGVPRMLPRAQVGANGAGTPAELEARTAGHFTNEFTSLAAGDRDIDPPEVLAAIFALKTGMLGAELEGKTVLDGGCGPGRFVRLAAGGARHVVGLDLGLHVERAAARTADLPNVDFVQGSVLQPPFRAGSFDFVYSLGVLHHTPDARQGCIRLAGLVAPGGAVSIWVYPPEYWGGPVREPIARLIHRRVSARPPQRALELCRRWLFPLGRLQLRLARRRWSKWLAAPLFVVNVPRHEQAEVMLATIYDYYGPPIITTHDYPEVEAWLAAAGLGRMRRLGVATAVLAVREPSRDAALTAVAS